MPCALCTPWRIAEKLLGCTPNDVGGVDMSDRTVVRQPVGAKEVAVAIRQIAAERNLLRLGGAFRPSLDLEVYQQSAIAFSDEAANTLERQAVTAVGFNEAKNTVFVYTARRVTKRQEETLPFGVSRDVKIEYRQARPLVISDTNVDEVIGGEPYKFFKRSYACGSSISVGNNRSAGTLGAVVVDEAGVLYGLTNNHVTGGCNNSRAGLPIVAPGVMDVQVGFYDPFTIGWHHSVLQMRQGDPSAINHLELLPRWVTASGVAANPGRSTADERVAALPV